MQKRNGRKDVLSGVSLPIEKLSRFVIVSGVLLYDPLRNKGGRGIYLQKGKGAEAVRKRAFARFLHRPLSSQEEEAMVTL